MEVIIIILLILLILLSLANFFKKTDKGNTSHQLNYLNQNLSEMRSDINQQLAQIDRNFLVVYVRSIMIFRH